MRADQPVVSAASWMVSASFWMRPTLPRVCQGLALGCAQDRLALLRALLVEAHERPRRGVGRLEPPHDLARLHRPVALPGLVDADLGAGLTRALGLDDLVGLRLARL